MMITMKIARHDDMETSKKFFFIVKLIFLLKEGIGGKV